MEWLKIPHDRMQKMLNVIIQIDQNVVHICDFLSLTHTNIHLFDITFSIFHAGKKNKNNEHIRFSPLKISYFTGKLLYIFTLVRHDFLRVFTEGEAE